MTTNAAPRVLGFVVLAAMSAAVVTVSARQARGGQTTTAVSVDADDIGGVVRGPGGPEAGVWVIAETSDLPTKFARIVVTDDQGRYLVPDLPKANYRVWVRGYGLVDSAKVSAAPGRSVNLTAVRAPNPKAAAEYYPAGYWYSLLRVPDKAEFAATGEARHGIADNLKEQGDWLRMLKSGGCTACHALGTKGTRELSPMFNDFPTSRAKWERRLQSGQAGQQMTNAINGFGKARAIEMFADWTDRIAAGEVPPEPPRPKGVERNVVITEWDWADPRAYLHDEVSTDRRNPTVNANGLIYGALELSADYTPVLDPVRHTVTKIPLTVRDPATPMTSQIMMAPSPEWGSTPPWNSRNNVHNPMMDATGRVWLTSVVRPNSNPAFCRAGSTHPSAQVFPLNTSSRQLAMYDPKEKKLWHISTCYSTHHLMFAEDADNTLWMSGGGAVLGWLNTKVWDATHDEEKAQGWTPLIVDTNGNGKRDAYTEPGQPLDPAKDMRLSGGIYAASPAPDGTIWASVIGYPGQILHIIPGSNPAETALTEVYEPPYHAEDPKMRGYTPRGMDVDRNGVAWVALASGHMGGFDRRKCKGPLNGPNATGQHCPEGWTILTEPLPNFKGATDSGSAEGSYYTWVDQFNALGLGANTPINTGNASEGLLANNNGEWVVLRVPYPTGFYTKWMDGRIDDPNAGWKGRGLWSTVSTRAPYHMETGKGTTSKVIKFQLRPDPLAK